MQAVRKRDQVHALQGQTGSQAEGGDPGTDESGAIGRAAAGDRALEEAAIMRVGMRVRKRSILGVAVVVIGTLAAITEILSFAINHSSLILRIAHDIREWLRPAPRGTDAEPCEALKNVFERRLCEDKRSGSIRTQR